MNQNERQPGRRTAAGWLVGGGVVAVGFVCALSVLAGTGPYAVVGNADPGLVVQVGTPLLRLVADVAAIACIGGLAFAACVSVPVNTRLVSPEGFAALRSAGWWAIAWCAAACALVVFDAAGTAGQRLSDVVSPAHLLVLVDALEAPKAWLLTAVVALVVAIGSRSALRWQPALVLLCLAIFALLPPLATGHVSADTGHDVATAALMVHVPAAALWIGVLLNLIVHLWRGGRLPDRLARRYARLAAVCWLVVAVSGVAAGWWLVPVHDLVTTPYGLLVLANLVLLVLLGLGAVFLRRRALRDPDRPSRARLLRLASAEFAVLAVTVAVSVGATHLAPAALLGRAVTGQQTLLGYDLAGPPTPLALVADWRIDVFFAPLAVVLAALYLWGVRRLRRQGRTWPLGRTAAWLGGWALVLVATSSGLGRYAPAMFSAHIAAHMVVAMLVPMLLVLGGPLSLAGQAFAPSTSALAGPREWVRIVGGSRFAAVLTHPVVALALFAGAPFALYFTGLFDAAMRFHWAHQAITGCFLVIGYVFAWAVIGVDPLPRPLPNLARVGLLLAAMPADALFAAAVMNTHRVIGNGPAGANMYSALALPWARDLPADQWTAGLIALLIGELSLLVALAALLLRWSQVDDAEDSSGLGGYRALTSVR
ncbi:bifunctional copper resistance protein CopD/cytochrome c oxidase assembly protein [Saccharopolyspora rosea]|uniref:Bifunctional copper resistance protein CopD/cytochrome c oxidase assembly protein n=1 Tax=Saccharopolyspora rosea TaxID=524884 RepID=A0ABW3FNC3_9PSEU|nr:bifunctional copper resistance protein CopD/cytochrome c oxidase assembly protein [Saccharopolyspora rosea]